MGILDKLLRKTPAVRAQQLLDDLDRIARGGPSPDAMQRLNEVMNQFTETITDSRDPAVTDVLLRALTSQNPGMRGLAIQGLGLVYDSRALATLVESYPRLSGDHRQRAVPAIVNLVNNRDKSNRAIPILKEVAKDKSLSTELRSFSVIALCNFRRIDPSVEAYLAEIREDPNGPQELKVAAI